MIPGDEHDPQRLRRQAALELVQHSLDQVIRTQYTTPVGWLLVLALAWARVPVAPLLAWTAGFALSLAIILIGLHRLRRQALPVPVTQRAMTALAFLDGLCWGLVTFVVIGPDHILNNWIFTLLCCIALVNAPPRLYVMRAYGAQLLGLWLPCLVFGVLHWREPSMPQMTAGLSVFIAMLWHQVGRVSKVVCQNTELRLENEAMAAQLRLSLSEVQRQAETDPLTGLPNRRAMDAALAREHDRWLAHGVPMSVLVLDIDHFKRVNDAHGHDVGDRVLVAFAQRVAALLRPGDLLVRTGGEEFVALLARTEQGHALAAARRVREAVADRALLDEPEVRATVSIGVASLTQGQEPLGLIKAADMAVYDAKRLGRNRVCVAQPRPGGQDGATMDFAESTPAN